MKVKEAIGLLNPAERAEVRSALEVQKLGNQVGIVEWYSTCLELGDSKPDWDEDDLYHAMNAKKPLQKNPGYLRTRTSRLVKHIEQFLVLKALENDEVTRSVLLLQQLNQRNWGQGYAQTYKVAIQKMDEAPLRTFAHYSATLAIESDHILSTLVAGSHDHTVPLFQKSLQALDLSYVTKKMALCCKALSQDRDRGTRHELDMMEELIRWAANVDRSREPLIHLYYLLYCLIAQTAVGADSIYFEVKQFLRSYWVILRELHPSELTDVFTYLINFCALRINQGAKEFRPELVELYEWLLPEGVLYTQGKLSTANFRNAFVMMSLSEDQAALDRLITTYGDMVDGETALSTVLLCRGYLAFRQGALETAQDNFEAAVRRLPLNTDPRLEVDALGMLVRVSYLRADYPEARNYLRALSRFLGKNKLLDTLAAPFRFFADAMNCLIRAVTAPDSQRVEFSEKAASVLNNAPQKVFARDWIQKEISQLLNKKQ